jgi:arabinofuranan 3-O-arabinosyltransferase
VQLQVDQYLAASRPTRVEVTLDDGPPFTADVTSEGRVSWSSRTFRRLSFRFLDTSKARTVDPAGLSQLLPVGVSEVVVAGAEHLATTPAATAATGAACGFGPTVDVGGHAYATRVSGSVGEVLTGRPLIWTLCAADHVEVSAGRTGLVAPRSAQFLPVELLLRAQGGSAGPAQVAHHAVTRQSPTVLTVALASMPTASVVVVPQNFNAGWAAVDTAGHALTAIRVNGWQQGWVVPAGSTGELRATFLPDRPYRLGLAAGGGILVILVVVVLVTRRREGPPVPAPAAGTRWSLVALPALLALGFGWPGLVGALVGVALALRSQSSGHPGPRVTLVLAGVGVGAALAVRSLWPQGNAGVDSVAVQLATLVAVGTLTASAAWAPVGSPRRPLRIRGRSIP